MALRALLYTMQNFQIPDFYGLFFSVSITIAVLIFFHVYCADVSVNLNSTSISIIWASFYGLSLLIKSKQKDPLKIDHLKKRIHKGLPAAFKKSKKNKQAKKKKNTPNCVKKSKYKNMDSPNEGCNNGGEEKTVVYKPLLLFEKLQLNSYQLYCHLLTHILSAEQLHENGFPMDTPENPGRVCLDDYSKFGRKKIVDCSDDKPLNPNERRCCRCGDKFFVSSDGSYEADNHCRYHCGKMTTYNGIPGAGPYECCNKGYMSEGCVTQNYHVTSQSFLDNEYFVKTKFKKYLDSTRSCTVYALDCEMCYTTKGFEVTKVGLVGVDGLTVYDSYVLPENQILDYNTTYSGVTARDLRGVKTTLTDVQAFLMKLLNKDTILIGHGLENDLKALRVIHEMVVDTSVVFPHHYGPKYKKSLKSLASEYLKKTIQSSKNGHNCIEDARACMELMLWKISIQKRQPDENKNIRPKLPPQHIFRPKKTYPLKAMRQQVLSSYNYIPVVDCRYYYDYIIPPQEMGYCREGY